MLEIIRIIEKKTKFKIKCNNFKLNNQKWIKL